MNENSNSIFNVPTPSGCIQAEDTLLSYPPAIKTAQEDLLEAIEHMETVNAQVKEHVARFNAIVNANPVMTNADKRSTELKRIMVADGDYQKDNIELGDLKFDVEIKRIDLEYLNNMFRSHLAIVGGRQR